MRLSLQSYKKAVTRVRERYRKTAFREDEYVLERVIGELERATGRNLSYRDVVQPPRHERADIALTGSPDATAAAAAAINGGDYEFLERAAATGPFLNVTLRAERLYARVLEQVAAGGERYGSHNYGGGRLAVIDYSSPNIAKPIGVGHLRSTIIGEALARLYERCGYAVLRDNYLGDWGQQFGKLLCAYERWGKQNGKTSVGELKDLYVRFEREAKDDEVLEAEAREYFRKLEAGDRKLTALWKKFRELSIKEFEKTYGTFGVKFDVYGGESPFVERAKAVTAECLASGACRRNDEGAVIADVDGLPTFLLERTDGATLYHARDLAQLAFRFRELEAELVLYVVGNEQSLHFKQLFALAGAMGVAEAPRATHVGFGLVLGDDGKRMSTRKGTAVELGELAAKATGKAEAILREKAPELKEKERRTIARQVGIGAIVYNDLRQSREKNIRFDWERMLDVEAGSALYLQYTAARIRSLLAKVPAPATDMPLVFAEAEEYALALKLLLFPKAVRQAQEENAPHAIAAYLEELAALFNLFYNTISVSGTDDEKLRASRRALADSVGRVLRNGLEVLNVPIPERL